MKKLIRAKNIIAAVNVIIAIIFSILSMTDKLTGQLLTVMSILLITFSSTTFLLTVYVAVGKKNQKQ